ncbi:Metal-dependent hydrolase, endonuclease/exonuclease/phosphatase family [Haladaptatus litoreus]|uniref:Metal-dependent hydrolase, endonuclease/exonuclease/phosphatase family n=1 Tax=Haladaptatus litoreus TaxID=553468 RepID=A0A1N7ELD6_9EURY|nr:endonuclease/exonuclease/phosphatase family protein [Haladaptatus litoreus]SIR88874.1 Metal-dependent hydrolase, endonuclease/exonuclease/phosphatase family [Haladaptatus litoreus]
MFDEFPRRKFIQWIGATSIGTALGISTGSATTGTANQYDSQFPSSNRPTLLKACSFNIRYDNPDDEYSWDERLSRVAKTITDIDSGLLGIQEAQPNQYDDLREEVDEYNWYGVGREDGDREGEMVPVAWDPDRFEAIERGAFWLSETPDEPSVGWDADLPRVTTWVSLRHRETRRRLWFCNTHFSHVGETARTESAKLIRKRARERSEDGEDVVITGDFNSKPSRKPYQIMTGTGGSTEDLLFDPRREANTDTVYGPWGTYHGFTNDIENRIDYIFTLDTATISWYRTLDVQEDNYRSDHLPIVTEFEYSARCRR